MGLLRLICKYLRAAALTFLQEMESALLVRSLEQRAPGQAREIYTHDFTCDLLFSQLQDGKLQCLIRHPGKVNRLSARHAHLNCEKSHLCFLQMQC